MIVLAVLAILALTAQPVLACHPILSHDCEGFTVEASGGSGWLTVKLDGLEIFKQWVSDGFTKKWTFTELGKSPCDEHDLWASLAGTIRTATIGGPECCWDKSSLVIGDCSGDCDEGEVEGEVCNVGEAMTGPVDYELYFAESGPPKPPNGSLIDTGTVPALNKEECITLTYTPVEEGNYAFKVFQRPGHPGTGVIWSTCSIECPPSPPGGCFEPATESGCEEGLVEQGGLCVNILCPEVPTCICPPELDWSADCEGVSLTVHNLNSFEGTVEYLWEVNSAIGTDTISGTCILPGCGGFTAPWPEAPVGETQVAVSWTTTWDAGGSLSWTFQCGEMPEVTASADCGFYGLGIEARSWPETVTAEVEFSVTHQLDQFSVPTGISTEPGTANSFLTPWPEKLYGLTAIEWLGSTSWGESFEGSWEGVCGDVCGETYLDCPDWQCGSWSTCQDGIQTQSCTRVCKHRSVADPEVVCYKTSHSKENQRDCEEEQFVPEWGTLTLLGSGLSGLAGYIKLRLRKK